MNQIQKEKLQRLAHDDDMLGILRVLAYEVMGADNIIAEIKNQPTNMQKGERVHAIECAKDIIDEIFRKIDEFRKPEVTQNEKVVVK